MRNKVSVILIVFLLALQFFDSCDNSPEIVYMKNNDTTEINDSTEQQWDSTLGSQFIFNNSTIKFYGKGAVVSGNNIRIYSEGTYSFEGNLDDGTITVDTKDKGDVKLVFNGTSIKSTQTAPVYIENAIKTIIYLAEGTYNYLSDPKYYLTDDEGPNATLFSKDDLVISGMGTLTVEANYNDGISGKDALTIESGTINVNSVDDGIRGKDFLFIENGKITINSGGDGLKSDNDELPEKGFIKIESGELNITSSGDAIVAETDLVVQYADIKILAGGGCGISAGSDISAKGLKALNSITILDGNFNIDASEDALNSKKIIRLSGGSLNISSKDDGIHSDSTLLINGGNIKILTCYEGLESSYIVIDDGILNITSQSDGINVAGGSDAASDGTSETVSDYFLKINGGNIYVNAIGDGIDVNGYIDMAGGNVIVEGPEADDNSPLDFDSYFTISGGFLIATGSSRMAKELASTSTQNSVMFIFDSALPAGTIFNIQTCSGTEILTISPSKKYQSIIFSSPDLILNNDYQAYTGGSHSGSLVQNIYRNGSYTKGTKYADFTISDAITTIE